MARTRRSAPEARRAILEAAEKRLREGGPEAVRLQDLARDLGVSHPAILHHFGSREKLIRAVMRDAQTFPLPEAGDSAADWLAEMVRAYLKNVTSRRPSARASRRGRAAARARGR